jgi:hypothetical protein
MENPLELSIWFNDFLIWNVILYIFNARITGWRLAFTSLQSLSNTDNDIVGKFNWLVIIEGLADDY